MPWIGSTSMFGMLRAASRKLASTSEPSMISALTISSLPKRSRRVFVLASLTATLSSTRMPPSLALAESACLRASTRTFLGSACAWLRGVGPNERPPPRNRFTRAGPCRALPVPFCRYIFLPVRLISARFFPSWVPAWRLASCQLTQRARISGRGLRPKIASDSVTDPADLPSSVVTFNSMSRTPLFGRCRALGRGGCALGQPERAGLRRGVGQRLLHGIAYRDPAALGARNRALDQDEAALDVGLHDLEIERRHLLDAEMASHFLVLERLARVLAPAGRAVRTMRDGDAVRST